MKNTIRQVFHSPKFLVGFCIFVVILLTIIIYPLINPGNPLQMIGLGTFAKPGTYVSLYDSINTETSTLKLPDADEKRVASALSAEDKVNMVNWFVAAGVSIEGLNVNDTEALIELWKANYDTAVKPSGMTKAMRNYYARLNESINASANSEELTVTEPDESTGEPVEKAKIAKTDYVNVGDVTNVKTLRWYDNFGATRSRKWFRPAALLA